MVLEGMESFSDGTGFSQMIQQNILPLIAHGCALNQCGFWHKDLSPETLLPLSRASLLLEVLWVLTWKAPKYARI